MASMIGKRGTSIAGMTDEQAVSWPL